VSNTKKCALPGCELPVPYDERNAARGKYCSPEHADDAHRAQQRDYAHRQYVETPFGTFRTVVDAAVIAAYLDDNYFVDQYRPEKPDGWRWTWVLQNCERFEFEDFAVEYEELAADRAERLETAALNRGGLRVQADQETATWALVAA
jgi:hypothetical protein